MATRVSQQPSKGQTGLRNSGSNRGSVDDGTVFSSMTEFKFWVIIVTLLIFLLFMMSLGLVYLDKKIKKAEAILIRAEQVDKKSKQKTEPEKE